MARSSVAAGRRRLLEVDEAPRQQTRPVQDNYRVPEQPGASLRDLLLPGGWLLGSVALSVLIGASEAWSPLMITGSVLATGLLPATGMVLLSRMRRDVRHATLVNQRLLREVMGFVQPLSANSGKLASVRGVVEKEIYTLSEHLEAAIGRAADIQHQMQLAADTLSQSFTVSEGRLLGAIDALDQHRAFFAEMITHIQMVSEEARVSMSRETGYLAEQLGGASALAEATVNEVNRELSAALSQAAEDLIRNVSMVVDGDLVPFRASLDGQMEALRAALATLQLDVQQVFDTQHARLEQQLRAFEKRFADSHADSVRRSIELASQSASDLFAANQERLEAQVAAALERVSAMLSDNIDRASDGMVAASAAAGEKFEGQIAALEQRLEQNLLDTRSRAESTAAAVGESFEKLRLNLVTVEEVGDAARRDLERLQQGAAAREKRLQDLFRSLEASLASRFESGAAGFEEALGRFMDLASGAMARHAGDVRALIDDSLLGAMGRLRAATDEFREHFHAESVATETRMLQQGRELSARLRGIFDEAEAHIRSTAEELGNTYLRRSDQMFSLLREQGDGAEALLRETSNEVRSTISERISSFGDAVSAQIRAELDQSLKSLTGTLSGELAAQMQQVDSTSAKNLAELAEGLETFSGEMEAWREKLRTQLVGELGERIKEADATMLATVSQMRQMLADTVAQTKAEIDKSAMSVMVKLATEERAVTKRWEKLATPEGRK